MNNILDIGCGESKFLGSVGMDILPLEGVDVVHDLNVFPWPFGDSVFDRVIMKHSIAHLDNVVYVMDEVYRISKNEAIIEIISPHFSSDNYFTDPTHKRGMGFRSMNYFCQNIPNWKYTYTVKSRYLLTSRRISFSEVCVDFNKSECSKRANIHKVLGIEFLVNYFPRLYEKYFAFIFPANTVYFKLVVLK